MILGPETSTLTDSVLASLHAGNTRRVYSRAIADLTAFSRGKPLTRMTLLRWRKSMKNLSSSTVNVRLSAIRKLLAEAFSAKLISAEEMTDLLTVDGVPRRGARIGNWLTLEQARALLRAPNRKSLKGKRDYCILAILLGCALRRDELAALDVQTRQWRDGRPVFADIEGKGGRVRTVAIPPWVNTAIDEWVNMAVALNREGAPASFTSGRLIRRISLDPGGLSSDAVWQIVTGYAAKLNIDVGPHDLRRTCAKLCRQHGGSLEQIQIMLGHASIQTTERYLGSTQDLTHAVNDNTGLSDGT